MFVCLWGWLRVLLLVAWGFLVAWGCCRCLLAGVWGLRVLVMVV